MGKEQGAHAAVTESLRLKEQECYAMSIELEHAKTLQSEQSKSLDDLKSNQGLLTTQLAEKVDLILQLSGQLSEYKAALSEYKAASGKYSEMQLQYDKMLEQNTNLANQANDVKQFLSNHL